MASFVAGKFDFRLVVSHIKPEDAAREMAAFASVAQAVQDPAERDVILLGDFNADCTYFDENDDRHPLKGAKFHWVIGNDAETAVKTGCSYDRIVLMDGTFGHEYVPNSAQVFRYDSAFGIRSSTTVKNVSDHFPVFAEFTTTGPDDDGPCRTLTPDPSPSRERGDYTRIEGAMLTLESEVLAAVRSALQSRGIVAEALSVSDLLQEALGERYRLVSELGRGAMGVVYLAWEKALDRYVALKVLAGPGFARSDAEARALFLQEARTAARLAHPNIVPVHAVDQAGDYVFFTMEYVEGETVAERVRTAGPLAVGEATRVLRDAARAVAFAHSRRVIHRDLKPENIMLERGTGRVLVMDFGIAIGPGAQDMTKPGYVVGTPPYLAPELVTGGKANERTDVYALGVTGYFMVTGAVPFDGDTPQEMFFAHVDVEVPFLPVYGEHGDISYAAAVDRCLRMDRRWRFFNATVLAEWLSTHAPELRRALPVPLRAFLEKLRATSHHYSGNMTFMLGGTLALVFALATGHWLAAAQAAACLLVLGYLPFRAVLPVTRRVLEEGYTRADLVHALSVDVDEERDRLVFQYGSAWNSAGRLAWRIAWAGVGLVGVATLLSSVTLISPDLGLQAIALGTVTAVGAGLVGMYRARGRRVSLQLWREFWKSKAGEWAARWAGWRLKPKSPPPPEIAMLEAPSFEQVQVEATRDLVNQLPVVQKLATSRIARMRDRLEAMGSAEASGGQVMNTEETERLFAGHTARLNRLLYRLTIVRPGVSRERITEEYEAMRRACDAVDRLLEGRG